VESGNISAFAICFSSTDCAAQHWLSKHLNPTCCLTDKTHY